jgi:hypothetical protein
MRTHLAMSALTLAMGACVPELDSDDGLVLTPRVLAVRADPPEARPGDAVRLQALVADPEGNVEVPVRWSLCRRRPSLADPSTLDAGCLQGDAADPLGEGAEVTFVVPTDACSRFSPDPPPTEPGEPAGRPADPDITGGYRLPVLVTAAATPGPEPAHFELRLLCNPAGVTPAEALAFRERYRPNTAPRIERVRVAGREVPAGSRLTHPPGTPLGWEVTWEACPDSVTCGDGICGTSETLRLCPEDCASPAGCGGAEPFVRWDPGARDLVVERESLRVGWLATSPFFAVTRTGVASDEPALLSGNQGPVPAGVTRLWLVLRDSRGGVDWWSGELEAGEGESP